MRDEVAPRERRFQILTVCTGNICRSPLAEAVLRRDLNPAVFTVSSAGTMNTSLQHVPRPQLRIAEELGLTDLDQHRSRRIGVELLTEQDLVLAMSRGHRRQVARLIPVLTRQVFTLREFATLARAVTPADVRERIDAGLGALAAAVDAVASKRGHLPLPAREDEFDIIDPFKKSRTVYRRSRDQLVPPAEVTAEFLNLVVAMFGRGEDATA